MIPFKLQENQYNAIFCQKNKLMLKFDPLHIFLFSALQVKEYLAENTMSHIKKIMNFIPFSGKYNWEIIENAPISIMVIDKKGDITFVNKQFKMLTGSKAPLNRNIFKLPFFIRENLRPAYKKLLSDGTVVKKECCYTENLTKEPKYINITAVPIKNEKGLIAGAFSMAVDDTETVLARMKLERLNNELETKVIERTRQLSETNRKYGKSVEAKMQFIADASHELKTPLAIIKLSMELEGKKNREKKNIPSKLISTINKEIDKIDEVLSDLMFIGTIDGGDEKMAITEINLSDLISRVAQRLNFLSKEKNIKIIWKRNQKDIVIKGDRIKLEKLFLNIIKNAIKYGNKNGWVKIQLKKDLKKKSIRASIQDNGIGIPKNELPYIFDRFYRSTISKGNGESGFGLGLAICKWIAGRHNGYISVESSIGKGSLFAVTLPIDSKIEQQDIF